MWISIPLLFSYESQSAVTQNVGVQRVEVVGWAIPQAGIHKATSSRKSSFSLKNVNKICENIRISIVLSSRFKFSRTIAMDTKIMFL